MSHSIYFKKQFLEISDGRVLPLVLIGDSNVTAWDHRIARDWAIDRMRHPNRVLLTKEEMKFDLLEMYTEQIDWLTEFNAKYEPNAPEPDKNSVNYCGTSYKGGSKLKNMLSFYSTKHTIPLSEFLPRNFLVLKFEKVIHYSDPPIETLEIPIKSEEDLIIAHDVFKKMYDELELGEHMVTDVRGICHVYEGKIWRNA